MTKFVERVRLPLVDNRPRAGAAAAASTTFLLTDSHEDLMENLGVHDGMTLRRPIALGLSQQRGLDAFCAASEALHARRGELLFILDVGRNDILARECVATALAARNDAHPEGKGRGWFSVFPVFASVRRRLGVAPLRFGRGLLVEVQPGVGEHGGDLLVKLGWEGRDRHSGETDHHLELMRGLDSDVELIRY
eukprot:951960-Amorphochlora_amoeboformis.AAC.1